MKIVIFGASGRTGQHLITQTIEQGHTITTFARTSGKIVTSHDRFRVLVEDIHDLTMKEDPR